jgi:hypothetical protein
MTLTLAYMTFKEREEERMVGVKGKSGRHKRDCSCEKCNSRRIVHDEKPVEAKEEEKTECC